MHLCELITVPHLARKVRVITDKLKIVFFFFFFFFCDILDYGYKWILYHATVVAFWVLRSKPTMSFMVKLLLHN